MCRPPRPETVAPGQACSARSATVSTFSSTSRVASVAWCLPAADSAPPADVEREAQRRAGCGACGHPPRAPASPVLGRGPAAVRRRIAAGRLLAVCCGVGLAALEYRRVLVGVKQRLVVGRDAVARGAGGERPGQVHSAGRDEDAPRRRPGRWWAPCRPRRRRTPVCRRADPRAWRCSRRPSGPGWCSATG